jgi:hypothetical protein
VLSFRNRARTEKEARLGCASCPSGQGFASGFLPTPPRGDAVAFGSELALPRPLKGLFTPK